MRVSINTPQIADIADDWASKLKFDDDAVKKTVTAYVPCTNRPSLPVVVWQGDAYSNVGDYKQSDLVAAITTYLTSITVS